MPLSAAGVVTSLGPCVAPRYVAVATLLGERRRTLTIATFVAGILTAYAAIGFGTEGLGELVNRASVFYLGLAAALTVSGLMALLRGPGCAHERHDVPERAPQRRLSAVFSLGAASAFVISPCCTPILAAVAGMAAGDANPLSRAALLAAFALGHAAPLFVAGSLGAVCVRTFRKSKAGPAPAVVSGTLMLALGAYYGLLA